MHSVVTVLTLIACIAICVRLLTYRRGPDTTHRLGVGWCAWLLIVCTGGRPSTSPWSARRRTQSSGSSACCAVLAVLTYRARGNVARILRVD